MASFEQATRVLASWRPLQRDDDSSWMFALLRRAMVAACVVALLSVALGYRSFHDSVPHEMIFADSLSRTRLSP